MSMARRSGIPLSDILRHLDSDDDLGMDSEYEYDSDNSVEGIYIILAKLHFDNNTYSIYISN